MDADTKSQEEAYEEEQAVVPVAVPQQHEPHGEGAEEHGHAVDLTFHSRKPNRVAEEVAERTYHSTPSPRTQ